MRIYCSGLLNHQQLSFIKYQEYLQYNPNEN